MFYIIVTNLCNCGIHYSSVVARYIIFIGWNISALIYVAFMLGFSVSNWKWFNAANSPSFHLHRCYLVWSFCGNDFVSIFTIYLWVSDKWDHLSAVICNYIFRSVNTDFCVTGVCICRKLNTLILFIMVKAPALIFKSEYSI